MICVPLHDFGHQKNTDSYFIEVGQDFFKFHFHEQSRKHTFSFFPKCQCIFSRNGLFHMFLNILCSNNPNSGPNNLKNRTHIIYNIQYVVLALLALLALLPLLAPLALLPLLGRPAPRTDTRARPRRRSAPPPPHSGARATSSGPGRNPPHPPSPPAAFPRRNAL